MQAVKMYTTAVCPYCIRAKQILKAKGVEQIEEIRVDVKPDERIRMMEITGQRTVPQIFIGATHVGGHDDLVALGPPGRPDAPAQRPLSLPPCTAMGPGRT
jgi:glutaredoxin 3